MQHEIPVDAFGPLAEPMADAVSGCVHCGFCLPTCPTYVVTGEEMHSPRGRIVLMKEVLEGGLRLADAAPYLDACLGCLACVTACPSGVAYGELITPFRMETEGERSRSLEEGALRRVVHETLPHPRRLRAAAVAGGLAKPFAGVLPRSVGALLDLLPERVPPAQPLPDLTPAIGRRRARVALLAGCAQQVLAPGINAATVRVLARNGVEVLIPKGQSCCGALAAHAGLKGQAQRFARQTMRAFADQAAGVDAVLTNAAGCGSGMHEYALWLRGEREETDAASFAAKVRDVSVFLAELGVSVSEPTEAPPGPPLRVAYHDACHLAHAQGVTAEPRALLRSVAGIELLEIAEPELCCGSAGTYNLEQPLIASRLGERKARHAMEVEPDVIATGNIGCMTQLRSHLGRLGSRVPVLHTMEVLDRVYGGRAIGS
jgi:glycolate oxidase iron-sulfur subunit